MPFLKHTGPGWHHTFKPLMSRDACNGERGLAIQIVCQNWPLGEWRFWRKWQNLAKNGEFGTNGKKSPEGWDIQNVANIEIGC